MIIKYEVCYQLGSTDPDCTTGKNVTGVNNTMTDLTELKPATMYTVAVRAFTAVGAGPFGRKGATTHERGEFIFYNACVLIFSK